MIGQRLKLSRTAANLSLRDLEGKIGNLVTAQAIGKYERNESVPSSKVLIALAKALGVSVDYLVGEQALALEKMDFRKKWPSGRKEEAALEAKVLSFVERYLAVEELLALPSRDWDKPREAPYPVDTLPNADRAARSLRMGWGLGVDPIPDIYELFEERGIKVLCLDTPGVDGMTGSIERPGRESLPVVVVNKSEYHERQRFTLAHELGHMLMEFAPNVPGEKACNRFAGAFLMPIEALWSTVGKHRSSISIGELCELKKLFGVSAQALTYRLKDVGIISDAQFKQLFDEFESRGWRSPPYNEPNSSEGRQSHRFERLCYRALAEGAISEARAAELLGISVRNIIEKMDNPVTEEAR